MKDSSSRTQLAAVYVAYASRYIYPLIMLPYYARAIGPAGYGIVLAGMSLANSLWLFVSFGFPTVGSRDTVHALGASERAEILKTHVSARLLLCLPAIIAGLAAIYLSLTFRSRPLSGVVVIGMGLTASFNVGWYLVSTGRALASIRIEIIGFVLTSLLIFGFVHQPTDVARVFPLLLVSAAIQLGIAYWLIRAEFDGMLASVQSALRLIRQSTTIFIYGGTSVLLTGASTYLLSTMATPTEVSSFGIAERLIAAGLSLMSPAAQILVPKVTYMVGKDPFEANRLTRRIFVLFFSGAVVAALVTVMLSGWLIPLVFGDGFRHSVPVLNLMVFVLPISVCTQVLGMYFLVPRKLERLLARAGVVSAVVNLACAIPLASHWGALGMAGARLIGELTMFVGLAASMWRARLLTQLFDLGGKLAMPAGDNTIRS